MAKKEDHPKAHPESTNGEISTIRDILMGHKISENEARFEAIEARIDRLESNFSAKLKDLESKFEKQYQRLHSHSEQRFENIERMLASTQDQFHEKVSTLRREERANMSSLLSKMSKNLLEE